MSDGSNMTDPILPADVPADEGALAQGGRDAMATLQRAQQLVRDAQAAIEEASRVVGLGNGAGPSDGVEARLVAAENERAELTGRLADVEHQVGRLMTLYVATYQ
ncbi:MAG: hypothetical protein WBV96_03760, partial [Polyangia bacterium]